MKGNHFNKLLGIGPGGIECKCCIDYSTRTKNYKRLYSRRRREVEKRALKRELQEL